MIKTILLSLLLFNTCVIAQSPQDSLYSIWNNESQTDTVRLNALNGYFYAFRVRPDTMLSLANRMYDLATSIPSVRYQVDALIQQSRSNAYLRNIEFGLDAANRAAGLAEEIDYYYGQARALALAAVLSNMQGTPTLAIEYYDKSYEAANKALIESPGATVFGDIKYFPFKNFIPSYHKNVGLIYNSLGAYVNALDHYEIALKAYLVLDDQFTVAALQNNIALVHMAMEEYDKAMEYYVLALPVFEEIGHKQFQANVYGNMANIYIQTKSFDEAEDYTNRNLKVRQEMGDSLSIGLAYLQFSQLYLEREDYPKALEYAETANEIFTSKEAKMELIYVNLYKGDIFMKQGKLNESTLFFEKSLELANELQSLELKKDAIDYLYQVNKKKGQKDKALEYHEELLTLSDSLNIDETGKKLLQVEFSKKFLTDSLLQQEEKMRVQLAYEKEILQQTNTRNIFLGSGMILLIISGGLWNRLSFTRKSKATLQVEKDRSENLLLNILPAEVAEELKATGKAAARDFDLVSIIFTDFKAFTETSEKLSAAELVGEINYCFEGFDSILEKYGIEKIKTIGDAYMAAGGLPVATDDSVGNTVKAALEMQAFIAKRKLEQDAIGLMAFEMRCGVHTGPVVAGIVGVKKFQYDIWGDTVNTANRMESNGQVGNVNISKKTYMLIKDDPHFTFESRGKIQAKGKGEIEMYFVRKAS